ncbi:MAG: RidA family protein [Planctomycetaceae bacterium]|nr:RidA family protein [Planctomycetaceae bacterium]
MPQDSTRRSFLREGLLASTGAVAGWWLAGSLPRGAIGDVYAAGAEADPGHEQRLQQLGLKLPDPAKPVAVYVTAAITGNLLYTAGHIPLTAEGKPLPGRLGQDFTLEQGRDAAHDVGLSILSTVRNKLGSLDRVVKLVKVLGMVNCTPEFAQQPQVINGFSELMIQVFGEESGKAARSAVGVAALPGNCPVEIEAIFEILPADVSNTR